MDRPTNPDRMTCPQAAAYLGVSPHTTKAWRRYGLGPAWHKVGRRVVYDRDDLDYYLDRHRVDPERTNSNRPEVEA